jgi:hypothetical protein
MHLPEQTPALRGRMLELMSRLVGVKVIRDFVLNQLIIKSSGVDRLPDLPEKPK